MTISNMTRLGYVGITIVWLFVPMCFVTNAMPSGYVGSGPKSQATVTPQWEPFRIVFALIFFAILSGLTFALARDIKAKIALKASEDPSKQSLTATKS